jgi:gas vesicle protein
MNKVLIAFTSGLIIGLLIAPEKGSETREKISNLGNTLKENWNDITDKIAGGIDRVKQGVDNVAESAMQKVENTQFDTGNVV